MVQVNQKELIKIVNKLDIAYNDINISEQFSMSHFYRMSTKTPTKESTADKLIKKITLQ